MFDVMRFKPDVSAARLGAALVLVPARHVALVFPFGARVAIGEPAALTHLAGRARAIRKQITIVGGDAHLRACAAVAGIPVATTLDEYRHTASSAASEATPAASHPMRGHESAPSTARLTLLDSAAPWAAAPSLNVESLEPLVDDGLPDYLLRLLPSDEELTPAHDPWRRDRPERPSSGRSRALPLPSDAETFAAAELASERHEEDMSDAIFESSGGGYDTGLAH